MDLYASTLFRLGYCQWVSTQSSDYTTVSGRERDRFLLRVPRVTSKLAPVVPLLTTFDSLAGEGRRAKCVNREWEWEWETKSWEGRKKEEDVTDYGRQPGAHYYIMRIHPQTQSQ